MLMDSSCFPSGIVPVQRYQLNRTDYAHLFSSPQLIYLFALFREHEYPIRLVGGVVRDLLVGSIPHDIDLATPASNDQILAMIRADSNIQVIYTRAEQFGTLTLVVGTTEKKTYQITTLKKEIIRQGSHVTVKFTDDWSIDAQQRDLTINSLSMDENGIIYDYTGGFVDLKQHRIRFNGSVADRIQENPIRILRYFRFFARFSQDPRAHERTVLENIERYGDLLKYVPGEKLWMELESILRSRWAGHVMRTILECQLAPILNLPNSTESKLELENRWLRCKSEHPEPITLLITLFDDDDEFYRFHTRMKLSTQHKQLGYFLLNHRYSIQPSNDDKDPLIPYKQKIFAEIDSTRQQIIYHSVLELLKYQGHQQLHYHLQQWSIPNFPLDFNDLSQQGLLGKSRISRILKKLRNQWQESACQMSKQELIESGFRSGLFYT